MMSQLNTLLKRPSRAQQTWSIVLETLYVLFGWAIEMWQFWAMIANPDRLTQMMHESLVEQLDVVAPEAAINGQLRGTTAELRLTHKH